jgi:hypothetical protein
MRSEDTASVVQGWQQNTEVEAVVWTVLQVIGPR